MRSDTVPVRIRKSPCPSWPGSPLEDKQRGPQGHREQQCVCGPSAFPARLSQDATAAQIPVWWDLTASTSPTPQGLQKGIWRNSHYNQAARHAEQPGPQAGASAQAEKHHLAGAAPHTPTLRGQILFAPLCSNARCDTEEELKTVQLLSAPLPSAMTWMDVCLRTFQKAIFIALP
ncbi:hypothetical protein CB1_116108001 [Camelus ferus]|nr:hypothetical protein CB1_116108001 [Camelus ferus]